METKQSDQQLMGRLAAGDDAALGELMKRWAGRVLCYVERMCGYLGCSEDICQDVWTRVFLSRRRFDFTRPFAPLLFSVATNCCRTVAARAGRDRARLWDRFDDVAGANPSALSSMVWRERCRALYHAIYRLPDRQRSVVLLYLLMDGSYRHVADALDMSEVTARSHMSHALKALRRLLDAMSGERESAPEPEVNHDRSR